MQIKDIINKISKDQFEIRNLYGDKPFALTESTPYDRKGFERNKTITIDLGGGEARFLDMDTLLLVLKEFYGEEFLIDSIKKIKPYDEIRDITVPNISIK